MSKMPLALTIDFGTQSVRALIFNKSGETLAIEKYVYQPAYFLVHQANVNKMLNSIMNICVK